MPILDANNVFMHLGPLMHYDTGKGAPATLVGIVAFGTACATIDWPGYYSRVNQVLPWINTVMLNCSTCPPIKTITRGPGKQTPMDKTRGHSSRITSSILSKSKTSDITSTASKSSVFFLQIVLTVQVIGIIRN